MTKPIVPILLLATLLGGCATMEPHYVRPDRAIPPALPTGPAYPAPGAGGPAWAGVGWSDFFADPRLKQVIAAALANNRDLRIAIANIEKARAQYRIQRSALIPQVTGQASATYGETSANSETIPGLTGVRSNDESYALSLGVSSYELDLWGRVRSLNKESLEQYLSTEESRRATQISLISETATAWLTLASDRTGLDVAQRTLASAQASVDVTVKRFSGGIASQLDVRQAETIAQQARAQVAQSITSIAQDQNALQLLVGAPVPDALQPTALDDNVALLTALPTNLDSRVLLTRPDVVSAEHQLRAANFDIGATRAAFFPTISLTGSAGLASTSLSSLFTGGSTNWSVSPSVTLPFLNIGKLKAQLDQSKAEKAVQVATYEKALQTAFREVADALARRGTIDEEVAADQAVVAAAADSLRLSTLRYAHGSDTYLNVLDAQRTLYSAEQTLVAARLTRAANMVTLYQVLGGGLSQ
jgi:multidrug efflux system outer membrane protein